MPKTKGEAINLLHLTTIFTGEPGSSVGGASDPRSRCPGFKTRNEHLEVESDYTYPALSKGRCACGDYTDK